MFLGRELVLQLPRQRGDRGAVIDFRHVVGPLYEPRRLCQLQAPGAVCPAPGYRAAYDRLVADHGERPGVVEYLQVCAWPPSTAWRSWRTVWSIG